MPSGGFSFLLWIVQAKEIIKSLVAAVEAYRQKEVPTIWQTLLFISQSLN
ncbi:BioY protein [Prevotella dentalis DSM 3688]|uniref:BioY protein n=1 Tax=Prevotella dentalis (strain ATCC 49559 / DSM 3688 / JCM 13448 / NCTC 12043 / ES 2772) TaxID=908937 RepID=F9D6J1_PREDD|nr:BioY protein [Prevotella dentalis DSM 3688]